MHLLIAPRNVGGHRPYNRLKSLFRSHPSLAELLRAINGRVVGGAVRNALLDKPVKGELDIASPYLPARVMKIGQRLGLIAVPIKLDHGTVLLVKGNEKYEVTTLRQDIDTDGRWATVRYTRSWARDAYRRDFTINSLYMDGKKIYDYTGGLSDLKSEVLRFVGEPVHRIQEDFVRILRLFRFWAQAGFRPSVRETSIVHSLRGGLVGISKERILTEMLKLYETDDPWSAIAQMYESEIVVSKEGWQILYEKENRFRRRFMSIVRLFQTVDTSDWPLAKWQKQLRDALGAPPKNHGDLMRIAYIHGLEFARDSAILFLENEFDAIAVIGQLGHFPLLPSELPVSPGPEMGRRFKELREWWMRQWPAPSKEDCIAEYCRIWGD